MQLWYKLETVTRFNSWGGGADPIAVFPFSITRMEESGEQFTVVFAQIVMEPVSGGGGDSAV